MLKAARLPYVIIAVIMSVTMALAPPARAENLVVFYQSPTFGATGNSQYVSDSSALPFNRTVCLAYGLGNAALAQPAPDPSDPKARISDFTGLSVPSPATSYQRTINPALPGATSCQIYGNHMGFQLHPESAPNRGRITGIQLAQKWSTASASVLRPWSSQFGASARLRLQTNFTIPNRTSYPNYGTNVNPAIDTVQYAQMFVGLADAKTNQNIWYVISLWDSRGYQADSVLYDDPNVGGTTNFDVVAHLNDNGTNAGFATRHPRSQNSVGTVRIPGCGECTTWYAAYVSRQQLRNAVAAINRQIIDQHLNRNQYSDNPDDYYVNFVGVGSEQSNVYQNRPFAWIGSQTWDTMVLVEH